MKTLTIIILIIFNLTTCGPSTNISYPIKANIVTFSHNKYEYKVVSLPTLTSVHTMEGKYGVFYGNSLINIKANTDNIIEGDNSKIFTKRGKKIALDYVVEDGVIIPLNYDSMALLAIYHNLEVVNKFWEEKIGLKYEDIGKPNIYYDPSIGAKFANGVKVEVSVKFNAAFIPGLRDFIFFKTASTEQIPFKFNLGIIAHEFGHSIFDLVFANKDIKTYDSDSNNSIEQLSGINEGLADYFSWMITQNTASYQDSHNTFNDERSLPVQWTSQKLIDNPTICEGSYYCKGSILASALLMLANNKNFDHISVGKLVISALPIFRQYWNQFKNTPDFDYHYLVNSIIMQTTSAQKAIVCTNFLQWFDDKINKKHIEKQCNT